MIRPARQQRGFTLLELGVVVGVAAILLTIIGVSATVRINNARNDRIALELQGYAHTAAGAWVRGIKIVPQPPLPPIYQFGAALTSLQDTGPGTCYDLSLGTSKVCNADAADSKNPGQAQIGSAPWSNAQPPDPAILGMFPNGVAPNNGYNPYCGSYEICMYNHRAEARTCVPTSAAAQAGATGGTCPYTCQQLPNNTETPVCIVSAVSPMAFDSTRMQFSVSTSWSTNLKPGDRDKFLGCVTSGAPCPIYP